MIESLTETLQGLSWDDWGLPLLTIFIGLVAGLAVVLASRSTDAAVVVGEGARTDLEQRRATTVQALRDLELEKAKMAPEDYRRERDTLLKSGADALRQLEEGPAPTAVAPSAPQLSPELIALLNLERARLGGPAFRSAVLAHVGAAPSSASSSVAAWVLGGVVVLGALLWLVSGDASRRVGDQPMTGGDPSAAAEPEAPEAAELLARVERDPNDLEALNRLTLIALSGEDAAAAMQWNERALAVAPQDPDAQTMRAVLRAMMGMGDSAVTLLDEVLAQHPDHAMALVYRGLIAMQLGRPGEAVAPLERALANDAANPDFLRQKLAEARAAAEGTQGVGSSTIVAGTVTLASGVEPTGARALFVSVLDPAGGPPLASVKLSPGPFPAAFQITEADRIPMGGNRPIPDAVNLSVQLDVDGDPRSRSDAEPMATQTGVRSGTTELKLVLR